MKASLSDGLSAQVVGVLVAIAFVSAVGSGALSLAVAIASHQDKPWMWAGVAAAVVFVASWLLSLSWWSGVIKAIVGIESPQPSTVNAAETVKLDIRWDEGRAGLWDDLEVSKEQLVTWARGVNSGKSLGENHWTPKPFSKTQYHQFRDKLISRELIRLHASHYSSGYELTAKGRATVRGLAEKYNDSTIDSPTQTLRLTKSS